ncbi:hypothetical protein C4J81_01775 [Deltaproteobacteria bacterium Smac51]|nr:hypothetical protein C4J81_01775 [Deltaproteobacteria bacterium Smac51]
MTMKFHGNRYELKTIIDKTGMLGDWEEITSSKVRYCFFNGAIINWWPKTKSLQIQGSKEAKDKLQNVLNSIL